LADLVVWSNDFLKRNERSRGQNKVKVKTPPICRIAAPGRFLESLEDSLLVGKVLDRLEADFVADGRVFRPCHISIR